MVEIVFEFKTKIYFQKLHFFPFKKSLGIQNTLEMQKKKLARFVYFGNIIVRTRYFIIIIL